MERGPFLNEKLQKEFGRFVEIVLHTDGRDERFGLSSQRNKALQMERFGTVALPYYVLLDPAGKKVFWQGGGTYSAKEFLEHLKKAP